MTSKTMRQPGVAARGLYTHTKGAELQDNQQFAATQGTFTITPAMQQVGTTT